MKSAQLFAGVGLYGFAVVFFLPTAKAAQTDEFFIEMRLFFYKKNRRLTDERLHVQLARIGLKGQQMAQALIAVRERINAAVV